MKSPYRVLRALILVLLSLPAMLVAQTIQVDDSITYTTSPTNGIVKQSSYTLSAAGELAGFDPSGSDKLVVTISGEGSSVISSMTYAGAVMSGAIQKKESGSGIQNAAIYFLDGPAGPGDLVVNFSGNRNGLGASLLALSGTSPGVSVTNGADGKSVSLTTTEDNSFVVAAFTDNSDGATAQPPLTPLFGGPVGSAGGGSGYATTDSAGTATYSFANSSNDRPVTVAAAFRPPSEAPIIFDTSPADDSANILPWVNLVATFDEPITLKSGGTITITDLTDGSSTETITLPDARVTSPNGDDLAIDLTSDLEFGTHYSVWISSDAIEDQGVSPEAFSGILDDTTWDFNTRPFLFQSHNVLIATAEVSDALPAKTVQEVEDIVFNNAVNVKDAMSEASYGQMELILGDGSAMDPTVELNFPGLTAATANGGGNNLRLTMLAELESLGYNLSNYRFILLVFPSEVAGGFAGAAGLGSTWSVYKVPTLDVIMHELGHCLTGNHSNQDPGCALGWAGVNFAAEKKIRFGWMNAGPGTVEDVFADTSLTLVPLGEDPTTLPGTRIVRVVRPDGLVYHISYRVSEDPYRTLSSTSHSEEVFVSLDLGSTLTQHQATLAAGEVFTDGVVTVTCDSVAGDGMSADITIGIIDPAPTIAGLVPADNGLDVAVDAKLVATFSENVWAGTTGFITLKKAIDDSTVESFDVTNPSQVSFSGAQVTVDPSGDLELGAGYYVEIGASAIVDAGSNTFAGIADSTTWNFTTSSVGFSTVAYWQFDSSSGSAGLSDSVGGHDLSVVSGTFTADAAAAANPVPNPDLSAGFSGDSSANPDAGFANASLLAPGTGAQERLTVAGDPGNVFNLAGKDFTFEGWFQHETGSIPAGFGDMIGGTRIGSPWGGYILRMTAGGDISGYFSDGTTGWGPSTSGTNYNDGTFHHFALVWQDGVGDNSTGLAKLYIDGDLKATASAPAGWSAATADANDQDFGMAGRANSGNTWDGRLDEFRFVSSALDPSDFLSGAAPPANVFSTWISSAAFGLAPGDQGFTDDPDGDGLGNGLEAFFGTNPGTPDAGLTEVSKSGNTVTFQHPNPTTPLDDVTGSYRWSRDLQTWYDADGVDADGSTTVNAVATPDSPSANVTTVVATIGGSVPAKVFLRAVATMP